MQDQVEAQRVEFEAAVNNSHITRRCGYTGHYEVAIAAFGFQMWLLARGIVPTTKEKK